MKTNQINQLLISRLESKAKMMKLKRKQKLELEPPLIRRNPLQTTLTMQRG